MSRPASRGAQALVNLTLTSSPEAELLKEETAELAELFRLVDRENTGALSMQELLELLLQMSVKPTPAEMALLFSEMDTNHNGKIEMDEFMAFIHDSNIKQMDRKDIVQAFQIFEGFASPLQPGKVSYSDLLDCLATYAPDHLSPDGSQPVQRNERPSVGESAERKGRRASQVKRDVGDRKMEELTSLLSSIEWNADGYVDYSQFVQRNTTQQKKQEASKEAEATKRKL